MALPFSSTQSSSLAPGNTYNFRIAGNNGVGTTYGSSAGFTTTLPGCDAVANVAMDEDTTRTVTVSGITDNDPFETRVLSVTAASSNPGLLPSPTVTYSSPNPTANLQLVPAPNLSGTATVTVEVGYSVSGTVYKTSRSFTVTVNPVNDPPVAGPAYSLQFDGVNDYVRAGGIELASRSFTVEAWARNTRPNTWQMFVWQGQPEPNKGLVIGWRANNVFTFAFLYNDLNTSAAYDDQAWHHWACKYDTASKQRRIYRDGVLVAQDTATADYQGSGEFWIGRYIDSQRFQGGVDDVRVWTTVRTESEIRRNLSEPLRGDEAGLVAYWRFDEGSALTAHDSNTNPNAQDGQLIGGTAWGLGDVPYQWTVNENTTLNPSSKSIFLPAFDVDSASLTYTIVSGPSHGTLTGTGANRTYTPTLNYNGSDSFSYRVSDGPSTSGTVTVSISIEPVNTPPPSRTSPTSSSRKTPISARSPSPWAT